MEQNAKRYTVITGARSGIGAALARAFAGRGKNLVLAARRGDRLNALRQEILNQDPSLSVIVWTVDLTNTEETQRFYMGLRELPLETWSNNAGFGSYDAVTAQDPEQMPSMTRLNVAALTLLSTLFVQDYRDVPGAQLINVSSAGGYTIVPTAATYCATKFYVALLRRDLCWNCRRTVLPCGPRFWLPPQRRNLECVRTMWTPMTTIKRSKLIIPPSKWPLSYMKITSAPIKFCTAKQRINAFKDSTQIDRRWLQKLREKNVIGHKAYSNGE